MLDAHWLMESGSERGKKERNMRRASSSSVLALDLVPALWPVPLGGWGPAPLKSTLAVLDTRDSIYQLRMPK